MSLPYASPVCLAVLNPRGRDPYLDYPDGPDRYATGVHAPVNFHAYAAATCGAFFDDVRHVLRERERFDAVLVLIRRRTWITLAAVEELKEAGIRVLVCWKECSHNQVTRQLRSARAIAAYGKILELADGIVSPTLAWPPRCGAIGETEFWRKLKFIPTPYPIDAPSWDFSQPIESRVGIMIGTRQFKTESRNHIHAISRAASLAYEFGVPRVTVINSEGARGLRMLRELAKSFPPGVLDIIQEKLPYPEYMEVLASHRIVYQMDRSTVPGQVAGDSLLARSVCAGGSSTIEKLVFEEFSDDGSIRMRDMFDRLVYLLHDDEALEHAIDKSQRKAERILSFESVAMQFGEWSILA